MALLQLNRTPSKKELRWFAGLWFPAFCALVGMVVLRKLDIPTAAYAIWGAGAVLSVAGLLAPILIRPVYTTLLLITFPIGWVVSHLMLLVMYYLVMTPIGFLVRLFHDPMERRFDPAGKSYWLEREQPTTDRYFRQL